MRESSGRSSPTQGLSGFPDCLRGSNDVPVGQEPLSLGVQISGGRCGFQMIRPPPQPILSSITFISTPNQFCILIVGSFRIFPKHEFRGKFWVLPFRGSEFDTEAEAEGGKGALLAKWRTSKHFNSSQEILTYQRSVYVLFYFLMWMTYTYVCMMYV